MYLVHFACHKIVPRVRAQMLHSEIHIAKYFLFWYFLIQCTWTWTCLKKTTLTHCPHIHVWRKVKLCKIARHEIKKNPPHPLKPTESCILSSFLVIFYRLLRHSIGRDYKSVHLIRYSRVVGGVFFCAERH